MDRQNQDSNRRRFVRKLVSLAALGGVTSLLLGEQEQKARASLRVGATICWKGAVYYEGGGCDWLEDPLFHYDDVNTRLGVGTSSPQQTLSVQGALNIDQGNTNDGILWNGITFGSGSGEGIASKRTATGNQYGLDFYTTWLPRMSITTAGNVGIGTSSPQRTLHLLGSGPRILIESSDGYAPEVDFKRSGDDASRVWALYKHGGTHDLRFYQGGDKVTIQNGTGNVGIGTTNPGTKLHVVGGAWAEDNINGCVVGVTNHFGGGPIITQATGLAASTENVVTLLRGAGVQGDADKGAGVSGGSYYGNGVEGISTSGAGVLGKSTSGPGVVSMGNLGVGTTAPARMLHIQGNNAVARLDRDVDSASFIFTRTAAGNFNTVWKSFTFGVKATGIDSGSFFIGDMHTAVGGSSDNRILIDTNGNVGIGTTTPAQRLHVAGNVQATGFITGDVTFANGYKLTEDRKSGMLLVNEDGEGIARFDHDGNLHIKGKVMEDL